MVSEVDPRAAQAAVAAGAALVDVREPEEWAQGHVAGAMLIPLGELIPRMDEVPADRDVYVICRSGMRSGRAVELLTAGGHPRALNVAGGILRWTQDGLPVEGSVPR